jgi:hypothetical protein
MYRCAACDHPAQVGHQKDCPVVQEEPKQEEKRINIASGEDVGFEVMEESNVL